MPNTMLSSQQIFASEFDTNVNVGPSRRGDLTQINEDSNLTSNNSLTPTEMVSETLSETSFISKL